jgi:tetratricopeptide (TPR) repeat protein
MENETALEHAREVIKMATAVGHRRAKVLGLMLAGFVETESGNLEDAERYLLESLELSRTLGAGNFEGQALSQLAILNAEAGRMDQARTYAGLSVEVARKVGVVFFGPRLLAIGAALEENRQVASQLLREAEGILDAGCVSHNHFYFAQTAIEQSLATNEWEEAERYAAKLEDYTKAQPLPFSDFLIARGRALARWGRGEKGQDVLVEIMRLHQLAGEHRLMLLSKNLERIVRQFQSQPKLDLGYQ